MYQERYEIREKLGEGAMGSTWLVYDTRLGVEWAMKSWKTDTPPNDKAASGSSEIEAIRAVNSRFFPRIVEAFEEEGRQYLVMDRIHGITLEEKIQSEGKIREKEAMDIMSQLCEAIRQLHENTPPILHLDLKPSNIMLTRDGVRLIDFGSALTGWDPGQASSATPGFASPEQLRGEAVDVRSDIYSLGAVLYTMLTGRRPGTAGMHMGVADRWPGRLLRISGECREIIGRAMRPDRGLRFQSAAELQKALEAAEKGRVHRTLGSRIIHAVAAAITLFLILSAVTNGIDFFDHLYQSYRNGQALQWDRLVSKILPFLLCCLWNSLTGGRKQNAVSYRIETEQLRTMKSSRIWI